MPLLIIRNDITKTDCDIIVNAANKTLLGGGGVDGAIHKAAGKELKEYCSKLGGCETGDAKITPAFNLKCKYIIHTVGPVWRGGSFDEENLLRSCYKKSLALAEKNGAESVAFPLISVGAYAFPKKRALEIAQEEITEFLKNSDMSVYIVIFDSKAYEISKDLFDDVKEYIDKNYVDSHSFPRIIRHEKYSFDASPSFAPKAPDNSAYVVLNECVEDKNLNEMLNDIDESFSQMLLRKIDEKGITDAECYKKANIDRKLFSKIRNNINYKPKKTTVIAFAIALEMNIDETKNFLMKAGYALSHSDKFDIIIEYFITRGTYDIYEINNTLFAFDQVLLGV
ncbi:MAG: macro domain-containing protein [Clostridia bacterium]|nr:macro domain-containing protein [Clostridia bacterium]